MSTGVEVGLVIDLVASVIGIIDGARTVWDAVQDPNGQPEEFRQVAARLPLVRSIMEKAKSEAKNLDDKDTQENLEMVLESCEEKARKLKKIFYKVLPGGEDGRLDRYRKAMSAPFNGGRVEQLMEGILRDAQLIATKKLEGIATQEQVKDLAEAIKDMNGIPSSLSDEASTISQMHSGSGQNIASMGPGNTNNIVSGSGSFYHHIGSAHFANTTIHNHPSSQAQQIRDADKENRNVYWVNLRKVSPFFTGRKKLLKEMEAKLCAFGSSQDPLQNCFVVTGIGGEGKSEVCLRFATVHRHRFWGVFWIDASALSTIQRGYIDAAQRCQPDGRPKIEDFESAKDFFDDEKQPYLFVLDNADNIERDLNPYIPAGQSSVILITSRNDELGDYATAGFKRLEKLNEKDAIELLLKVSKRPEADRTDTHTDAEHAEAKEVVKLLTHHALAITQAGAYMKRLSCSLRMYHERFLLRRESLLRYGRTQDSPEYGDVYSTFEVSAKFLEKSKTTNKLYDDALELLGVFGHLYFTGVPEAMFSRAWEYAQTIPHESFQPDKIDRLSLWHVSKLPKTLQGLDPANGVEDLVDSLQQVLGVLRSLAIITINPDTRNISMFPLVHAWARDRLNEPDKQGAWACTMSLIALSTEGGYDHQDLWRLLLPHAETCIDASPEMPFDIYSQLEIGRAFYQFAWLFYEVDNYSRCKELTATLLRQFGHRASNIMNNSSDPTVLAVVLHNMTLL